MKPFSRQKALVCLLGLATIGFLLITASGLDSLEFSPGTPFSHLPEGDFSPYTPSVVFIIVLFAVVVVFFFGLFILTFRSRKTLGLMILGLAIIAGILLIMALIAAYSHQELPKSLPTPSAQIEMPMEFEADESQLLPEFTEEIPHQEFEQPAISPWILFSLSLGLVLLAFLLGWLIFRGSFVRPDQRVAFAEIAEQTVNEISAGKDWGNAITNCYAKMLDAVGETHKIGATDNSLTPAEFVALMVEARMPAAPAKRLTTLFERVRYGGKQATRSEIDEAVACLQDIVAACQVQA